MQRRSPERVAAEGEEGGLQRRLCVRAFCLLLADRMEGWDGAALDALLRRSSADVAQTLLHSLQPPRPESTGQSSEASSASSTGPSSQSPERQGGDGAPFAVDSSEPPPTRPSLNPRAAPFQPRTQPPAAKLNPAAKAFRPSEAHAARLNPLAAAFVPSQSRAEPAPAESSGGQTKPLSADAAAFVPLWDSAVDVPGLAEPLAAETAPPMALAEEGGAGVDEDAWWLQPFPAAPQELAQPPTTHHTLFLAGLHKDRATPVWVGSLVSAFGRVGLVRVSSSGRQATVALASAADLRRAARALDGARIGTGALRAEVLLRTTRFFPRLSEDSPCRDFAASDELLPPDGPYHPPSRRLRLKRLPAGTGAEEVRESLAVLQAPQPTGLWVGEAEAVLGFATVGEAAEALVALRGRRLGGTHRLHAAFEP